MRGYEGKKYGRGEIEVFNKRLDTIF